MPIERILRPSAVLHTPYVLWPLPILATALLSIGLVRGRGFVRSPAWLAVIIMAVPLAWFALILTPEVVEVIDLWRAGWRIAE